MVKLSRQEQQKILKEDRDHFRDKAAEARSRGDTATADDHEDTVRVIDLLRDK